MIDLLNELSVHTHYSKSDDCPDGASYMDYIMAKARRLGVDVRLRRDKHHEDDIVGAILYGAIRALPREHARGIVITTKYVVFDLRCYSRATRVECVLAALDAYLGYPQVDAYESGEASDAPSVAPSA